MFRIAIALLLFVLVPSVGATQTRVALVVGNSAYLHTAKLPNPRQDATDTASALRMHGFKIIEGYDLDKVAFDRKIREFAVSLEGAAAGVFFFAGHGLQVAGQNYLVPIDAQLSNVSALEFEMVRLDVVHRIMEGQTSTNILFLDACRDNPLARNLARAMGTRSGEIGRGLAAVESGIGTLISFSTQPGNVALDGVGTNSPFAEALASRIRTASASEDLSTLLIGVRNKVMAATNNRQVPWEHSALRAQFYFALRPVGAQSSPQPSPTYDKEVEIIFWNGVKDSKSRALLQAYLDRYPDGHSSVLARAMIEQTAKGSTPSVSAAGSPQGHPNSDPAIVVRPLQEELKRVGCYSGPLDGSFNATTKAALERFALLSKITLTAREPSEAALSAVRNQRSKICTELCAAGQIESNGKCVAKAGTHPTRRAVGKSSGASAEGSNSGSKGVCWTNQGSHQRIIPCTD